jgi:tRNA A-37 threonylcarbamoyl transferase component Bud32
MSTDPRIGTRIGPYEIEQLVGRGGMGVVYAGRHTRLNRRAAIKVLAPELAGDPAFRERFIRESELAAQLDHPNIIPIYDADESGGLLFIAMRFVRGADLKALLANQMRLPVDRTLEILEQVASALDYAHENGLVHRDVKPGNIMIEHLQRGGDRVFLTDFGLVRRVDATSRLTKVGSFVGTLAYAAPEQFEGGEVDGRADLYSLACVLYECLSGAVPFDRDSEAQVMFAHIQDPPPRLSEVDPSLPRGLDDVVQRAMAKSPAGRFAICGEMIATARARAGTTSLAGAPALPAAPPMPAAVVGPAPVAHPPGAPAWPQPLEPRHVAYTGRQYEIGSEGTSYAIWNRGAGGPALQRFPQTPAGWAEAWRHYQFWERIDSSGGGGVPLGRRARRSANWSLAMAALGWFPLFGLPFAIAGIVLGNNAKEDGDRRGGLALLLNIVALGLNLALSAMAVAFGE